MRFAWSCNASSATKLRGAVEWKEQKRGFLRVAMHSSLRFLLCAVKVTEDGFARVSPIEAPVQVRDMLNQRLCHHVMMTGQRNLFWCDLSHAPRHCAQRIRHDMSELLWSLRWSASVAVRHRARVATTVGSGRHCKQFNKFCTCSISAFHSEDHRFRDLETIQAFKSFSGSRSSYPDCSPTLQQSELART